MQICADFNIFFKRNRIPFRVLCCQKICDSFFYFSDFVVHYSIKLAYYRTLWSSRLDDHVSISKNVYINAHLEFHSIRYDSNAKPKKIKTSSLAFESSYRRRLFVVWTLACERNAKCSHIPIEFQTVQIRTIHIRVMYAKIKITLRWPKAHLLHRPHNAKICSFQRKKKKN